MNRRRQKGLTLVEMMIALVLGLLLIGGALSVLQSTQQSYRLQENMSRLQENGRLAMEILARDLRMAGFSQCGAIADLEFHNNVKGSGKDSDPAFDFDGRSSLFAYQPENALPGTDALRLRQADERSLEVVEGGGGDGNNANIKVAGNALGLKQDDVVSVTNCRDGDTFRITNSPQQTDDADQVVTLAHAANDNTSPKLQGEYGVGDRVMLIRELGWYVAETGESYTDGTPVTALFRETDDGPAPIVSDVIGMRLRYGVDNDGDGSIDAYERANNVTDWHAVLAVRVSLLLHTADDNLSDGASEVVFDNARVTAEDRRLLRVFTTTVALRNRTGDGGASS